VPRIGGVALQELNAAHINRLYAELLVDGRVQTDGGLSVTSVRRIHAMLRKALRDAVRWGRVERNATDLADPPSAKVVAASRRRSMQTWSAAELRRFLEASPQHPLHPLWVIAATTGLRRSELLGLRWADVDLRAGTLSVRQIVIDGPDGYRLELDQKSTSSGRTIHLSARAREALAAHHGQQARGRESAGPAWQDHDLVFPRDDGRWWNPPAITLAFGRAVKAAGASPVRLHDLRHTHASLLLAAGVNPKVVSERLGHSSVAFTLDPTPTSCRACNRRPRSPSTGSSSTAPTCR
jgi:integrase